MKLMKGVRERGMPPITRFLREFQVGERVAIDIDPSQHSGMPHHRFQGRVGIVIGMQGRAYLVEVKEGSVRKVIIASPVHLKKVQ
jgi:large subunit ribosomal protein L21e